MLKFICLFNAFFLFTGLYAETTWEISERTCEVLLDGYLEEWANVPAMILVPGGEGLKSVGEFSEGDLRVELKALWDEEYLYLAADWQDNIWDIQKVTRREAVWIGPDNTRRDRMNFFDNFKFHIRRSDYDYTAWISPRVNDDGPHYWCRLLEGYGGMERATSAPMITARHQGNRVTLEIVLLWKQLRIKPKKNKVTPLRLVIADSDLPGRPLEAKVDHLKWVGWVGDFKLLEAKR